VPYLIVLVIAVVVVVLVMRAANAAGRRGQGMLRGQGMPPVRAPRRPRPAARPLAPDDDPEFLRELERRARRDDNPTA
jgi:hypothetical protein